MNTESYKSLVMVILLHITVDESDKDHGFSVGVNINISGVTGSTGTQSELDAGIYNGSYTVTSASVISLHIR